MEDKVIPLDYVHCFAVTASSGKRCKIKHVGNGFCTAHNRYIEGNGSVRAVPDYKFWLWEHETTPAQLAQVDADLSRRSRLALESIGLPS